MENKLLKEREKNKRSKHNSNNVENYWKDIK